VGAGPKSIGWDVRAGGEYRCNAAFLARAGWSYGLSDRDDLTAENTYRHTAATTGFGYQPVGSRWSVDLGYAFEWLNPDFPDPVRSRETRQRLALQTRWPF
jgi:long-subunit fatty acid transport protein